MDLNIDMVDQFVFRQYNLQPHDISLIDDAVEYLYDYYHKRRKTTVFDRPDRGMLQSYYATFKDILENTLGKDINISCCIYQMICAGYAIWREFIADYIAAQINPFFRPISMRELKKEVSELDKEWRSTNPNAKVFVSQMLADILLNTKVREQESPEVILQLLEKEKVFTSKVPGTSYSGMVRILYKQLQREECWKIDVDFIWELGEEYLNQVSLRYIATQINWE